MNSAKQLVLGILLTTIWYCTPPSPSIEVKLKEIYNEIETKGFDNVAIEKSISETAIKGGNLGWINENTITKEFREKIVKTSIGKISEPIFLTQGILFFKIRDKRTLKKFISLEDTKNQLVGAKKTKMLNMYSLSHYDKLIRNISIKSLLLSKLLKQ